MELIKSYDEKFKKLREYVIVKERYVRVRRLQVDDNNYNSGNNNYMKNME